MRLHVKWFNYKYVPCYKSGDWERNKLLYAMSSDYPLIVVSDFRYVCLVAGLERF